ncbi:MAG: hypothetical protein CVU22_14005 [Betaproteobacteria bacterium HGW-Betaproteobacteria-16]|nr:MAG: hypothetical protein CVU22_14005 [Betaproteobacteria bacterium HGW-Betaproteobacteria-16]
MDSHIECRKPVFFIPGPSRQNGLPEIIDVAVRDKDGVLRSNTTHSTLEQMRERYPDAVVGELDVVTKERRELYCREFVEVDEDQFAEQLDMLPPQDWRTVDGVESFKCLEPLADGITTIHCRYGSRFYRFNGPINMTGTEIAAHVKRRTAESSASTQPDQHSLVRDGV